MSPKRPVSTPSTVDYLNQGNPNQVVPPTNNVFFQGNTTTVIKNTYNYLIPDGSERCIHDLQDKTKVLCCLWKQFSMYVYYSYVVLHMGTRSINRLLQ